MVPVTALFKERACPCRLQAVALLAAVAAVCLLVLGAVLGMPGRAWAATNGLTIYVGYAGGPYYEKASFSDAELRAMSDGVVYEYSALDTANYLRKGFARGVPLQNIMSAAGIDPNAMWRFYLGTADSYVSADDSYGTNGEAWYYGNLIATPRFYYRELCANAQFTGTAFQGIYPEGYDAVIQSAQQVPTIVAYESSFDRVGSFNDPLWNNQPLSTNSGYRLMFGQTSPTEITARDSAMSITGITCIIGGDTGKDIPVIELGNLIEELEKLAVGQSLVFTPGLSNVRDSVVAAEGYKDIRLTTDNPDVLGLEQNADGSWTITVKVQGAANLMARFGNSSDGDFVSTGSASASLGHGTGAGAGSGDGEGDGSGLGESGDGTGGGTADDGAADAGEGAGDEAGNAEQGAAEDAAGGDATADDVPDADEAAALSPDADAEAAEEPAPIVQLEAGTQLHSASLKADAAAESGTEGGSDAADGTLAANPQVFELVFDDESPLADSAGIPPLWLVVALAVLLAGGGLRRATAFWRARDVVPAAA